MKVIAIASRKGGSSKTTISVHIAGLADAESGCVVIDADPQASASAWYELRENERPFVVPLADHKLADIVDTARDDGLGYTIIDTPPHNEAAISEAMRLADLVLVPVRPSLFDLRAAETTFEMATALKRSAVAVITGAPPPLIGSEASIVREARAYLKGIGADVAKVSIGQRAAFSHSLLSGSSASEYEPNGKAAKETIKLWSEIRGMIS